MANATKKHSILFVDDEPEVTRGIRLALRKMPYRVLTANSAAEGLEILADRHVDVVVSDERMPEMGGAEFLTVVRQRWPETIRLILSGHSSLESAIGAINEAGIYRFLVKPCAPDELAFCLSQALEAYDEKKRYDDWERESGIQNVTQKKQAFEAALDSLWMAFQPIVRACDNTIFGYEALVRMPEDTLAGPGVLFDLAEELDRVHELEEHIWRKVGARLSHAPEGATILVNIHPASLLDEELFDPNGPLATHASKVVIEITERDTIHDTPDLQDRIARLRALGFRIAVDDLGAGYSGLTSFALLCPDIVKFDMELVQNIHNEHTKAKLVSSFTALCREMGIQTIAEGIEVVEERDRVIELRCDLIQGFFYASAERDFLPAGTVFEQ